MKLGFFTMPVHRLNRDYTQTLEEDREAIILADRLGYSEAYVGEHLTDAAENITSSMLFQASLISDTSQIRLGIGTANLSHSHPVLIAAQAAMLDHLLKGRFLFGISPAPSNRMPRPSASSNWTEGSCSRSRLATSSRSGRASLPTTSRGSTGRSRRARRSFPRSGSA